MRYLEYSPEQLSQRPGLVIILGDQFLNKCNIELNTPGLELGGDPDNISALTRATRGFTSTFRFLGPYMSDITDRTSLSDVDRYNKAGRALDELSGQLQSIQETRFGSKANTRDVKNKLETVSHTLYSVAEYLLKSGFLTQREFDSLTAIKPEDSGLTALRNYLR